MPSVKDGAIELNRLLEASFIAGTQDQAECVAEKGAWDVAESFGWRKDDGTWKSAAEMEGYVAKAIEVTADYVRVRVRQPGEFQPRSFRTIVLDKSRGIKAVIGRLKGKTTTANQSILFARVKGWTPKTAEKWVRDHGMKPV